MPFEKNPEPDCKKLPFPPAEEIDLNLKAQYFPDTQATSIADVTHNQMAHTPRISVADVHRLHGADPAIIHFDEQRSLFKQSRTCGPFISRFTSLKRSTCEKRFRLLGEQSPHAASGCIWGIGTTWEIICRCLARRCHLYLPFYSVVACLSAVSNHLFIFPLGHAFFWKNGVEHGDPSLWNMMYRPTQNCDVLNDFDLSVMAFLTCAPGNHPTGTIPFMAMDILHDQY